MPTTRMSTAYSTQLIMPLILIAPMTLTGLGCSESSGNRSDGTVGSDGIGGGTCTEIDQSANPQSAITLAEGDETTGYICPRSDQDYYKVEVPPGKQLLRVNLRHKTGFTALNLSYLILDANGDTVDRAPENKNNAFNAVHCLDPGTYYIQVLDQGSDAQDAKNGYTLSYSTENDADTGEPANDEAATAPAGSNNTGYISCTGDRDLYKVPVAADQLVDIKLTTAEATPVDIKYTLYEQVGDKLTEIASDQVGNGSDGAADLKTILAVPRPGTYFVGVSDADDDDSDVGASYTLTVSSPAEPDNNDKGKRNDHPGNDVAEATPTKSYGGSCINFSATGRIASKADTDYFRIDGGSGVSRNAPAVIQARLTFSGSTNIDPAVALIYPSNNDCTKDKCCRVVDDPGLAKNDHFCSNSMQCSDSSFVCVAKEQVFCDDPACTGVQNAPASCESERKCQGSATCIRPAGKCGVLHFERHGNQGSPAFTAQPIFNPGPWYVRVSDFAGDEYDYNATYTLEVSVCPDPDGAMDDNFVSLLTPQSNGPPLPGGDLNATDVQEFLEHPLSRKSVGASFSGHIAYEHDQDFFSFPNPCPGSTCMMGATYSTSGDCPDNLEVVFIASSGDSTGAFQTNGGTDSGTYNYTTRNACTILLRSGRARDTINVTVSDKDHNAWGLNCQYSVSFTQTTSGCPQPPCAEEDGTCYAP